MDLTCLFHSNVYNHCVDKDDDDDDNHGTFVVHDGTGGRDCVMSSQSGDGRDLPSRAAAA